jgi:hypothetical protein
LVGGRKELELELGGSRDWNSMQSCRNHKALQKGISTS